MKDKIFYFLQKLGFLYILKLEESYFKSIAFKKDKKPSKDVIKLNYDDCSPFKNAQIVSILKDSKLLLWFTEKECKEPLIIPESYLVIHFLLQKKFLENAEGIVIYDTEPKKIIVVKKSLIEAEFSKKDLSSYEVALLKKEFAIENVYNFDASLFQEHLHAAYNTISIGELFSFLSIDLDTKTILQIFVNKIVFPLGFFILALLAIEGVNYFFIEKKIESVKQEYKSLRVKTTTLRGKVSAIEEQLDLYEKVQEELQENKKYFESMKITSIILKETNSTILFFRTSENSFRVRIDTNVTSPLFERFIKSNMFDDLRIQNNQKNKYTGREIIVIQGRYK